MAEELPVADMKRAVATARLVLEQDAAEARTRGWSTSPPDSASLASLATGILLAETILTAVEVQKEKAPARPRRVRTAAPRARRPRTKRAA